MLDQPPRLGAGLRREAEYDEQQTLRGDRKGIGCLSASLPRLLTANPGINIPIFPAKLWSTMSRSLRSASRFHFPIGRAAEGTKVDHHFLVYRLSFLLLATNGF